MMKTEDGLIENFSLQEYFLFIENLNSEIWK